MIVQVDNLPLKDVLHTAQEAVAGCGKLGFTRFTAQKNCQVISKDWTPAPSAD